jgi:hypothetical protein
VTYRAQSPRLTRDELIARMRRRAGLAVRAHGRDLDGALKRCGLHALTAPEWITLCELYYWRCAYCGVPVEQVPGVQRLVTEHMQPRGSRGRLHIAENVVPPCPSCNARKGCLTPLEFMLVRCDLWERVRGGMGRMRAPTQGKHDRPPHPHDLRAATPGQRYHTASNPC